MTDSDREPQEDALKWAIRYIVMPVGLAVMAGYVALAVVDRQFEHQSNLPNGNDYSGIFATMTAAAANAQPTPNLDPTNTPPADPTATGKETQGDKDVSPTIVVVEPPAASNNVPCGQIPSGWRLYTVQPGNTLFSLAQQTGTTIAAIQQANCLYGQLLAYSQIWLPNIYAAKEEPTVEITRIVDPIVTVTPTITVTEPAPLPDLINDTRDWPSFYLGCVDGCDPTISFAVINTGFGSAGAFNVRLQFFSDPVVVLDQAVAGLEPGGGQVFQLNSEQLSNCYNQGCSICLTVDSFGGIAETNEANNQYCQTFQARG